MSRYTSVQNYATDSFDNFYRGALYATRSIHEKAVRQSVRLSVILVDCKKTKVLSRFIYHMKLLFNYSSPIRRMVDGDDYSHFCLKF